MRIKTVFTPKKLVTVLLLLSALSALSLGFRPWQLLTGSKKPAPAQTPGPKKKRVGDPQNLGFDSLAPAQKPAFDVSAKASLPTTLATYEINPAPRTLFSPKTAASLAAQFGFTRLAKASKQNSLYLYQEQDKTLTINSQIGTLTFSSDLSKLENKTAAGKITSSQASQKVSAFLKKAALDSQFINWQKGTVKTMGLSQGRPKQTGLASELSFYEILPQIEINNYPLLLPQPLYAQVSLNGEIVGLYTWFINLDGQDPQDVNLKGLKAAQEEVAGGQGLIFSAPQKQDHLNLNKVKLAYFAPPSFFVDFSQRHFLKLVYVFYDKQGDTVWVNAAKE